MLAEVAGGLLLIAGIAVRPIAIALIPVLLGAIYVHFGNGWLFTNPNGGWEYAAFLVAASVAQAFLGDGAFAMLKQRVGAPLGATQEVRG